MEYKEQERKLTLPTTGLKKPIEYTEKNGTLLLILFMGIDEKSKTTRSVAERKLGKI